LAYLPYNLTKTDGELNTAIGNLMADALMELSNPIFENRTGDKIDIVLLNFGGIRSSIPKGDITTRTAFQVMPFENEVVVATLKGEAVREMIHYLIDSGSAHPVAGIELQLEKDNSIRKVLIQGEPLQDDKTYHVATNDYLLQGGDNMVFFSRALKVTNLDYKIRNLLIEYFKQKDTLTPVRDQRFIRVN
jgi:2',3'-cyclic-nucleotide 2'-phosphodiesterase (5'-nucleotidase family)